MARQFSYRRDGGAAFTPADVEKVRRSAAVGHSRKAAGRSIETLLARTHETYRTLGTACIVKLEPPVFGPPTKLQYAGGAAVDYMGALAGGRVVATDAKGVKGHASLQVPSTPKDAKRLRDQATFLLAMQRMGGLVGFLCVDTEREVACIMTDVARVADGESVTLRHRDQWMWPHVGFASLEEIARGGPSIDYLGAWPR